MPHLRLLVLDDYEGGLASAPAMDPLRELAEVTILHHPLAADSLSALSQCDVILTLRERTLLDAAFFERCAAAQFVLQTGGHAYHLDAAAATRHGIVVALGRGARQPMVAVPELVMGMMLALVRQLCALGAEMRDGAWRETIGSTLTGRTLGILGYGRHGRPVARLARAFNMKVIAWDRSGDGPAIDADGVERRDLQSVLGMADIVSVHLRLSDESRGLLDRKRLWQMKRGAILDEAALIQALQEKQLSAAGLDVFAVEPLAPDSPLRTLPNVLLTPHIGWKVDSVLHEFVAIAAYQLDAWIAHRLPAGQVLNPEAMSVDRPRDGGVLG